MFFMGILFRETEVNNLDFWRVGVGKLTKKKKEAT
jgi:hypothetical protein